MFGEDPTMPLEHSSLEGRGINSLRQKVTGRSLDSFVATWLLNPTQ